MSLIRFRRSTVDDLPIKLCPGVSWYFRFLCLTATEIILGIIGVIMRIVISSRGQVTPWVSWVDTHDVVEFPFQLWRADLGHRLKLEEVRWAMVARAVVLLALFAFSNESRGCCWHVYRAFSDRIRTGSRRDAGRRDFGSYETYSLPNSNISHDLDKTITASSATVRSSSSIRLSDVTAPQSQKTGTGILLTDSTIHQDDSVHWKNDAKSLDSTRVEPGHGHIHDNNEISLSSLDAIHGTSLQWKDLPLLPHEADSDDVRRPSSVTTSESMYSTATASETEFTLDATMTPYTPPPVRRLAPSVGSRSGEFMSSELFLAAPISVRSP
ncbi:hypothetical protein H2248_005079 [Termitomyces sp. 'cryptogamus']|nr:hypothetical protein H2248_005079 [Termitomyces sp. 'cryptogamus']